MDWGVRIDLNGEWWDPSPDPVPQPPLLAQGPNVNPPRPVLDCTCAQLLKLRRTFSLPVLGLCSSRCHT